MEILFEAAIVFCCGCNQSATMGSMMVDGIGKGDPHASRIIFRNHDDIHTQLPNQNGNAVAQIPPVSCSWLCEPNR